MHNMALESPERKILAMQFASLIPYAIACTCKQHMIVARGGKEHVAVCYNKTCEHYRVAFTINYLKLTLVQYVDTEQDIKT